MNKSKVKNKYKATSSYFEYDIIIRKRMLFNVFINCDERTIIYFIQEFIDYIKTLQQEILNAKQNQFINFINTKEKEIKAFKSAHDVLSSGNEIKIN